MPALRSDELLSPSAREPCAPPLVHEGVPGMHIYLSTGVSIPRRSWWHIGLPAMTATAIRSTQPWRQIEQFLLPGTGLLHKNIAGLSAVRCTERRQFCLLPRCHRWSHSVVEVHSCLYAILCVVASVLIALIVPETKAWSGSRTRWKEIGRPGNRLARAHHEAPCRTGGAAGCDCDTASRGSEDQ
jgi:hypothetical protein